MVQRCSLFAVSPIWIRARIEPHSKVLRRGFRTVRGRDEACSCLALVFFFRGALHIRNSEFLTDDMALALERPGEKIYQTEGCHFLTLNHYKSEIYDEASFFVFFFFRFRQSFILLLFFCLHVM